jgi:hypothetical protein
LSGVFLGSSQGVQGYLDCAYPMCRSVATDSDEPIRSLLGAAFDGRSDRPTIKVVGLLHERMTAGQEHDADDQRDEATEGNGKNLPYVPSHASPMPEDRLSSNRLVIKLRPETPTSVSGASLTNTSTSRNDTRSLVPGAGLEPARPFEQRLLRPPRLPIPPSGLEG